MRIGSAASFRLRLMALSTVLPILLISLKADDKPPMGAPLVISNIETEQPVPMAYLLPDGKTAKCAPIRMHWISQSDTTTNDDAISFSIEPADNPASPIFIAQLWNASLASAMAWQQPWQGARWKILDTPVTDGTGLDASLAVGMISTSARRPYPAKTVVIGSLNPDGSLGPVSHLVERMDAAAHAGMTRVIVPSVQPVDTDASGQVVNIARHAADLHIDCVPVNDLISATETTMNDPLPDATLDNALPKYSAEVAAYIHDFAHREQTEALSGLKYAPAEADLPTYQPPRLRALWMSIYDDITAARAADRAGQVYVAYQLFARANGRMNGANAMAGQTRATFNVKTALSESDDLHDHLQLLMTPPAIDKGDLQSAVLVAEMAEWAFDIRAQLEGAQLITRQAYSQRSDATDAEKERAREAILFANAQCKYLLTQSDFYTGLLNHVARGAPINVDVNASHLLPQLIPAQLATARAFTDGILVSDLRDGLLFDPRLVAYVNVLRQAKADWDARQRMKEIESQDSTPSSPAPATPAGPDAASVKLNNNAPAQSVGFDPGNTYKPPHTVVAAINAKKLSDPALSLIWANNDCEIATLGEKYLRLTGTTDASTHEWRMKPDDRKKLDTLLQMAEIGARRGISFAGKTEIDPSVLAMIYEHAAYQRQQTADASAALDSLRNFWRCGLLGNMCWQLAHTHKAEAVDLGAETGGDKGKKDKKDDKKSDQTAKTGDESDKAAPGQPAPTPPASTNTVTVVTPHGSATVTNEVVTPSGTNTATVIPPPANSVAPNSAPEPAPAPPEPEAKPIYNPEEANIPVAPIAKAGDVVPTPEVSAATNVIQDAPAPAPNPPPAPAVAVNPPIQAPVSTPAPPEPAPAPSPAPDIAPAAAPAATNVAAQPIPPVAPAIDEANIPVAPVARVEDYGGGGNVHTVSGGGDMPNATNAAPAGPVVPAMNKSDNADAHGSLP